MNQMNMQISVGAHTIEIGIFNNQKTWNNEVSTLLIDSIKISEECPVSDADGDGIADDVDQCPSLDDALIGTSCDDNDPITINGE